MIKILKIYILTKLTTLLHPDRPMRKLPRAKNPPPPPPKKNKEKSKPQHHESKLQQACIRWFKLQYPKETIFAIPNGGYRKKREAGIMNGEGVLRGVCDLFLMKANNNFHGLFIEMKYGKNKLSEHQENFINKAKDKNYKVVVCYSLEEFMNEVNSYLK